MKRIFLLRAYGDFVIALQAIAKSKQKIHIVASDHLAPLYQALITAAAIPSLSIDFIDLGIQQGQLNFFTNKHLFSLDTIKQLSLLKSFIKAHPNMDGVDWVEQGIRIASFNALLGYRFKAVVPEKANVYQAYDQWLSNATNQQSQDRINTELASNKSNSILIFPDARLEKKAISNLTIAQLCKLDAHNNANFKIARFNNFNDGELSYGNFDTLIHLIQSADYIYTSDSLPAHIAQLLSIPHTIVYTYQGVNRFCTPYALQHQSFIETNGN
ncbi:MAG: hypothetical protein ACKOWO_09510 [Sediminibacterium sp.]